MHSIQFNPSPRSPECVSEALQCQTRQQRLNKLFKHLFFLFIFCAKTIRVCKRSDQFLAIINARYIYFLSISIPITTTISMKSNINQELNNNTRASDCKRQINNHTKTRTTKSLSSRKILSAAKHKIFTPFTSSQQLDYQL